MRKPRIGITSTPCDVDGPHDAVGRPYVEAVRRAGGVPVVMPVLDPEDAEAMLAGLDGLLLTGGPDVNPYLYGQVAVPEVYGVRDERDAWELALVQQVRVPVLGICRGMQLLNVASGGTLVQHLPAITDLEHSVRDRRSEVVHGVRLAGGSMVHSVIREQHLGVNTLHHQAVDQVGEGFAVTGWATDGVVEAIESATGRPLLGVQWHPELLADSVSKRLFTWLVDQSAAIPIGMAATSMDDDRERENAAVA